MIQTLPKPSIPFAAKETTFYHSLDIAKKRIKVFDGRHRQSGSFRRIIKSDSVRPTCSVLRSVRMFFNPTKFFSDPSDFSEGQSDPSETPKFFP
eukprot:Pgem_evm1s17343